MQHPIGIKIITTAREVHRQLTEALKGTQFKPAVNEDNLPQFSARISSVVEELIAKAGGWKRVLANAAMTNAVSQFVKKKIQRRRPMH